MAIQIFQVDAFTDTAFQGNPAAVCVLPAQRDDAWMRSVAQEMNLSETAFIVPQADGFSLRWFTPLTEVDLCGHATLASAHVLWESGVLKAGTAARFWTRSGLLTAVQTEDGIQLTFPVIEQTPADAPPGLLDALGTQAIYVGRAGNMYLLHLADESAVRQLTPDFPALRLLSLRGVMVTAAADPASPHDFVSRYFAPWVGIDEDPVTGSAHCCLGPYWSKVVGKNELTAYQASGRGGRLRLHIADDHVELIGRAVTVLTGKLLC
ncbi:MAG TPA: PhzF family phenazine biosynthesis protein [Thiobacillus sp.]